MTILPVALADEPTTATTPRRALRGGAATVDITPPAGLPMWGYGSRGSAPATGTRDRLEANALVLAVGSQKLALVGLDLGRAPTRQSMATIAQRLEQTVGIKHLLLVASHTHHGPVIEIDNLPSRDDSYVRRLEDKLVEVVTQAHERLQPIRLGVAHVATNLNRNRHRRVDGAPRDEQLTVIRCDTLDGQPLAAAVHFAAHPTTLPADRMDYSADYPGALKQALREQLGCEVQFLQGAAGDLSPNTAGLDTDGFGRRLAELALELHRTMTPEVAERPLLQLREETFLFEQLRFDPQNPLIKLAFQTAFFPELIDFYLEEYRPGVRPRMTVALLDERLALVGMSGEFFCGHALSLRRRADLPHVLLLGYTNDYQQYFPTIEAAAQRGYGADPAVSPVQIGAGEQMIDQALIHLYDLRNQFKKLPF